MNQHARRLTVRAVPAFVPALVARPAVNMRDRIVEVGRDDTAETVRAHLLALGLHVDADPLHSATVICRGGVHEDQVMADAYFECVADDGKIGIWRAGPSL
jgi:hypothetical protein